jgi:AraC-like DNA-binding protein
VATIPLHWFLTCRLPGDTVQHLLNGEVLIETLGRRSRLDEELFRQWMEDLGQPEELRKQIVLLEMEARLQRLALSSEPYQPIPQRHEALSREASGAEKVAQIAYFIAQNYTERLVVENIAQHVELHPNYAMELFRRTLGMTLIDYLSQHRVNHAQRMLITSDESILNVAFNSGFHSLSRFNAVFKAYSGCTPRAYRRAHRLPNSQ